MWLATVNGSSGNMLAYYSDSPYSDWTQSVILGTGLVANDDISVVTALPNNTIGVLWSNQNTKLFGFRIHQDGADPTLWGADEQPAAGTAHISVGTGFADDHLNVKVAPDSTLYAAVKTSYDTAGYPKLGLLVRHPDGTWDPDLHGITESGTRPNIELDSVNGILTYIYTQSEGYNNIVYRQSSTGTIAFGSEMVLRSGGFNDVSSTRQNYSTELVTIFHSSSQVHGELCTPIYTSGADLAITKTDGILTVRPNDLVNYTIVVTNDGPLAVTGATVADTLPAALINANWTCIASGGASCTASGTGSINDTVNLPAGSSVTYSLSATVDLGARGVVNNTATVTAPGGITDPLPGNNTATDVDTIAVDGVTCEADPTLVGCWPMEEGSGSVLMDGSSYLNDAALVGAPAWAAGKVGSYALDLDGSNQYGLVSDDASLDLTGGLTLAAWIKPEVFSATPQDLIKKAVIDGTDGYELTLASTGSTWPQKVFFRINQATNEDAYRINSTTLYPIDGNTWMHVAATYDGATTTMRLYINGIQESELVLPAGTTIATNDLPLGIGAQSDVTRKYQGWIDEAARLQSCPIGIRNPGFVWQPPTGRGGR